MPDGIFRKKSGYTVVQNEITRDKTISLKAKGLYLVIQSYITMPGKEWKKSEFFEMTAEGEKAFDSAWNELKDRGYLKVHAQSVGTTWNYEFELLDSPREGAHTFFYNRKGEMTSTNLDKNNNKKKKKDPLPQNGGNGDIRTLHFGSNGNGSNGDGSNGNGGNNNKYYNINTNNNYLDINPSINPSIRTEGKTDGETPIILDTSRELPEEIYSKVKKLLSENKGILYEWKFNVPLMQEIIQELCDWNSYLFYFDCSEWERVTFKLAVECLVEMCTANKEKRYGEALVSYSHVLDQINILYRETNCDQTFSLGTFMNIMVKRYMDQEAQTKIKNPKAYMKALIWAGFSTYGNDWNGYFERTYHGVSNE